MQCLARPSLHQALARATPRGMRQAVARPSEPDPGAQVSRPVGQRDTRSGTRKQSPSLKRPAPVKSPVVRCLWLAVPLWLRPFCRAPPLERVGRSATHQDALRSTLRTPDDRYPYPRINSYGLATRMPLPLCEPNRLESPTTCGLFREVPHPSLRARDGEHCSPAQYEHAGGRRRHLSHGRQQRPRRLPRSPDPWFEPSERSYALLWRDVLRPPARPCWAPHP